MPIVSVNKSPNPHEMRRNDTLPAYSVQVYDEYGEPVDLGTPTEVKFSMASLDGTIKFTDTSNGTVGVGDDGATKNKMTYAWQATDTDTSGRYLAQFQLTYAGGAQRTFPASDKVKMEVVLTDDQDAA
jgi:hypothetical protein